MPRQSKRVTALIQNLRKGKNSATESDEIRQVVQVPKSDVKRSVMKVLLANDTVIEHVEHVEHVACDLAESDALRNDRDQEGSYFRRALENGQSEWLAQMESRGRPTKYKKVTLTTDRPERTLRHLRARTAQETEELRKRGFGDIRGFFKSSTPSTAAGTGADTDTASVIDTGTATGTDIGTDTSEPRSEDQDQVLEVPSLCLPTLAPDVVAEQEDLRSRDRPECALNDQLVYYSAAYTLRWKNPLTARDFDGSCSRRHEEIERLVMPFAERVPGAIEGIDYEVKQKYAFPIG